MSFVLTFRHNRWRIHAFMDVSGIFSQVEKKAIVTDEDMVRRIRKGENHYFEQLVNKYGDKMYKYLFYYFNFRGPLAEDVVQGLFVKLREKLGKYDTKQKFSSWMYRFAHNYTIDWIRKHEKDERVQAFSQMWWKDENSWHNWVENFVVSDEDVSQMTEKSVKLDLLQKCLCSVGGKYKDVLLLFYFEQKTYDEIAYVLDIKSAHVWTLLLRAKQKVRSIIEMDAELKDAIIWDI